VPIAATRIGAIVYAKSRRPTRRQFAPATVGFPRQKRILQGLTVPDRSVRRVSVRFLDKASKLFTYAYESNFSLVMLIVVWE
jgi:hypothetical protein